ECRRTDDKELRPPQKRALQGTQGASSETVRQQQAVNIETFVDDRRPGGEAPVRERGQREHLEIAGHHDVTTAQLMRPVADTAGLLLNFCDALHEISVEGSAKIDSGHVFDRVDRLGVAMEADRQDRVAERREHADPFGYRRIGKVMDEIRYSQ